MICSTIDPNTAKICQDYEKRLLYVENTSMSDITVVKIDAPYPGKIKRLPGTRWKFDTKCSLIFFV